jgi:uroporphyrinogen-III decarboxylase
MVKMTSRERVMKAVNHQEPDRVPIDLGGSIVSGIMAGALVHLRRHLGMEKPVKIYDAFQMLGEVEMDLVERFDLDILPVEPEAITFNHLKNRDYKPWALFDGTPVLVPGSFDVVTAPDGSWELHEDGDPAKPVVARMPKDGYYFDRQTTLQVDPNFKPPSLESLRREGWRRMKDEELRYLQAKAARLRRDTTKALVLSPWSAAGTGVASVGSLPDWLMLMATDPDYVVELLDLTAEIGVDNLKLYWQALGDTIDIFHIDGFDFGTQNREMFSPAMFERYHFPCYKKQCDWIHQHTPWKIAKHCCGALPRLIEPMIRAGIDILNPVQTSAKGMDPAWLKATFGDRMTYWGGGVDTQHVFSFGTPEQVCEDVRSRIRIFAPGGGFIWAAVHNVQYDVPPANILAALETVREEGRYPIQPV